MSVGNIESNERGTGARFNDGKPAMELMDFEFLASVVAKDEEYGSLADCLSLVGRFQAGGDASNLIEAFESLADFCETGTSSLLEEAARVFEYGREKYAAFNWAKGMDWSVPLGCIGRHSLAMFDEEELDPESGLLHAGHIVCNLVMLYTFTTTFKEGDDRPRMLQRPGEVPRDGNTLTEDELAELEASFVDGGRYELEAMRRLAAYEDVSDLVPSPLDRMTDDLVHGVDCKMLNDLDGYWYVATVYTSHPAGQDEAYRQANEAAARLHVEQGLSVFSPIAHSHSLCAVYGTKNGIADHLDADFWKRFDKPLLDAALGLAVVMMPNWPNSVGVQHEIAEARRQGKPVRFYTWPELEDATTRVEQLCRLGFFQSKETA